MKKTVDVMYKKYFKSYQVRSCIMRGMKRKSEEDKGSESEKQRQTQREKEIDR